jgi:copper homeostasis protein
VSARVTLEIAAGSLGSALAAQAGGADRVELCENLGEGGCTPSWGTLAVARDRLRIPLYVLIRPRPGDFVYDTEEQDVMLRDIEACVRLGCDGFVVGALDKEGAVDMPLCHALVGAAAGRGITFHRAFDVTRDRAVALEAIIALHCERVLTSGGHDSALLGAGEIALTLARADGRIQVMAGAGVTPDNVAALLRRCAVDAVHASARQVHASSTWSRQPGLQGLSPDRLQTHAGTVRALREAIDAAGSR